MRNICGMYGSCISFHNRPTVQVYVVLDALQGCYVYRLHPDSDAMHALGSMRDWD